MTGYPDAYREETGAKAEVTDSAAAHLEYCHSLDVAKIEVSQVVCLLKAEK
jgi:hypothetical protein